MNQPLLSARISVDYPGKRGVVEDVNLTIADGEVFGLAGESGSGKSTIALAILRLVESRSGRVRGHIRFCGRDLLACGERQLRQVRGCEISLVMQDPASALNPALRLERQLREAWCVHSPVSWREARPSVLYLLRQMGLPTEDEFLKRYPGQVSMGQAQRVVIAMAMLHKPKLVIADEPTSALDPSSRREILRLFAYLNAQHGVAILLISHDMLALNELCHRIATLQSGRLAGCIDVAHGVAPELALQHLDTGTADGVPL